MNDDFSSLKNLIYSGEGIIVGMTPESKPFMGYSLAGLLPKQVKILEYDKSNKMINIKVVDKKQLKQDRMAQLAYSIIAFITQNKTGCSTRFSYEDLYQSIQDGTARQSYAVMTFISPNRIIASSSGKITLIMQEAFSETNSPVGVLQSANANYEWDDNSENMSKTNKPNFTPRISGCIENTLGKDKFGALYIVRRSGNGKKSIESPYSYVLKPGHAWMLTTNMDGNDKHLLHFPKHPLEIIIASTTAEEICKNMYYSMNYRDSAAIMLMKNFKEIDVKNMNRSEIGE